MRLVYPTLIALVLSTGCSSAPPGTKPAASQSERATPGKQRARDLIDEKQYQSAIDILLPLSQSRPREPEIHAMLGESYWKLGRYDEATASFEASLRLDYSNGKVHGDFGQMLMENGKVGRALTEFELAIASGENDPLAHYNYGLALYEFGRPDAALAQWQIAFSAEPQNATYAEALGIGLTGKDDGEALRYFETASELGADDPSFHNNYGLLLLRLGRFVEAENHFARACDGDPENETYSFNLAVARLNAKHTASAIPVLEKLLAASPDNATYRIYLGRAYYDTGRTDDVIQLLEPWLSGGDLDEEPTGSPGLGGAYDALAMSYRALGQLNKALSFSGKAIERDPDNPSYLNNYGVILAENGRIEEARAQWEKVLKIEPDNEVAKQNLSAVGR